MHLFCYIVFGVRSFEGKKPDAKVAQRTQKIPRKSIPKLSTLKPPSAEEQAETKQ